MPDVLTEPEQAAEAGVQATKSAPPPAPALAAKANDLEAIRTAVTDAAGVSAGLWLSYLFVLFYLLVAAGGVTHRDLFFENPVKLPFLNVDLPLKGFFWLGPALFLIVHAYVLLHFVMLASKIHIFDTQLRAQIGDPEVRTQLREQLPSNIFVQFLAGPRELRDGIVGLLLWLIALISLVIGPVALLVFFQLQFLPYHDEWITWWQRVAVVVDLALLWALWPRVGLPEQISRETGETRRRRGLVEATQRMGTVAGMVLISVISVPLVFTIATFPGEWLEKLESLPLIEPLRVALVAGKVDLGARKPASVWSNRLVLPGLDVIDHTKLDSEQKIAALHETVAIRARHLERAVLIGAGLRKVDFTSSNLSGALLFLSDLRAANLSAAGLQGAKLYGAQLQGASLNGAQLQGASLDEVQLQGATLYSAYLQGASLNAAHLQGASLNAAQLQAAHLEGAQLQAAHLEDAQLQGAVLILANLQGASLDGAQLQGALLGFAQLQDASLRSVFVWRADARQADTTGARISSIEPGPKYRSSENAQPIDWSAQSFSSLKQEIEELVPEGADGDARKVAQGMIEKLNPQTPLYEEKEIAKHWDDLQRLYSTSDEIYEAKLAKQWRKIGCSTNGAPYVLATLTSILGADFSTPFSEHSVQLPQLAADFLKDECAGARGLSEDAKSKLMALRESASQKYPNAQPTDSH
jgi:uncharacterized protein YjbI with pentapeptide repeats